MFGRKNLALLAESKRVRSDAGVEEFDFKRSVFYGTALADEVIESWLADFSRTV